MYDDIHTGPTGEYPDGRIAPNDGGELRVAIGTHRGNVVLNWGTPTEWVAMPPDRARALCRTILKHAASLDGGSERVP